MNNNFVYHGSHEFFEHVVPKKQVRWREDNNGNFLVTFDEISFHATPHKWIALAYMCQLKAHKMGEKKVRYNMGVSLYGEPSYTVVIHGFESLEKSLAAMYKVWGYLYTFHGDEFFHMEWLGDLEVITKNSPAPLRVEHILNPIDDMKDLGVSFEFIDLAQEKNAHFRRYETVRGQ
jgi:hypothetical protein